MSLVAIPVKDQFRLTNACVSTLDLSPDDELVLIDNGSTDGTAQWAERAGLRVHYMADATLCEMWDWAIAEAAGRHIALLNNDIAPGRGMLAALAAALDANPKTGIVYPATNTVNPGLRWRESFGLEPHGMTGWAFMLRGSIDWPILADLYAWWFGDTELEKFCLESGLEIREVAGVRCDHVGGGSQTAQAMTRLAWRDQSFAVEADRATFENRWRGR